MKINSSKNLSVLKATVSSIIVAFIYSLIIIFLVYLSFGSKINSVISIINLISVNINSEYTSDITLDLETSTLTSYPEYATIYGELIIESIDVDAPIYFGDSLSILKNGIGHTTGSYFPGEGGTIIYMGHNSTYLKTLEDISIDDIITVETTYGTFEYQVYETKIIYQTEKDELPIQREEEILMLYTCHTISPIGHTPYRFVVYARRIS